VAARHIPQCKDMKAKPSRLVRGGGRGAHVAAPPPPPPASRTRPYKENGGAAPTYPRKGVAAPRRSRAWHP